MRYHLATEEQLNAIIIQDKSCPSPLLEGVATEMMKRGMLINIIIYSANNVFNDFRYITKNVLQITRDELIQLGHIEIYKCIQKFKPGARTPKTYFIMCLLAMCKKLLRDANAEKRKANINAEEIDINHSMFISHQNVERQVIAKMTIESMWHRLRPIEQQAIIMEQSGYTQYEIAESMGFNRTHGNKLLERAYKKMRRAGA